MEGENNQMKNELYIYHNQGLGDHIICNGLVRVKAKEYDEVFVICKVKNLSQVSRMYADDPKIIPFPLVDPEKYVRAHFNSNFLIARPKRDDSKHFDELMYQMAGVDFCHKWDSFYVERDSVFERYLEREYWEIPKEYIFIHDDHSRGFNIEINTLPVFRPSLEFGVFDHIGMIEKATQVHCIDSSFMNLIDCAQLKSEGLFFHKYVRIKQNKEYGTPTLKLNWEVIE